MLTALAHAVVLSPPPLSADATAAATAAAAAAGEEDAPFWPGQPGGPGGVLPKGEALVRLLDDAVSTVKQVYCELPNYAKISEVLLSHGLAQLHKHAHLTAGSLLLRWTFSDQHDTTAKRCSYLSGMEV